MKKLFIVFATGLALAACNDTPTDTGTGGSIDSNYMAPDESSNVHPDSVRIDSNNIAPDAKNGNSSGESGSGAATNSKNSGAAKDDTNGSE
jgi:hypothetical protein